VITQLVFATLAFPAVRVPPSREVSKGDPVSPSTFYTQINFTRTIEQILGITPMNQNDLVASPISEIFIDNPPVKNFLP
jgi:hypothetical protein